MSEHASWTEKIDRLFVEGILPERPWRELAAHLEGCEACRHYYERLSKLSVALGKRGSLASSNIEAAVLDKVLAQEKRAPRVFFWAALASVAALLAFLFISPAEPTEPKPQPRGDASERAPLRLRLLCASAASQELRGDTITEEERVTQCPLQGDLVLTYLFEGAPQDARYLFVVGFDSRGLPLWYTPKPREKESTLVRPQPGVIQRAPGATRLEVNHIPGKVRVFAILSDAPLSVLEVERAAQSLRENQVDPTSLKELPLRRDDLLVTFSDLEVLP